MPDAAGGAEWPRNRQSPAEMTSIAPGRSLKPPCVPVLIRAPSPSSGEPAPCVSRSLRSSSSPSPPPGCSPRGSTTSRRTTPSTSTASRCGTASGSSPPSTSPRTTPQTYPILLIRTPVQRRPVRRRPVPGRPRPVAAVRQGRLHLRLPGRARPAGCPRASSSTCGRTTRPRRAEGHRREHATPTTPSTGCSKNVPNHNGKVGQSGISYPGFYTVCGMIDAHPALKAASPQAPVTDWFVGDDFHHNGAFFLPHCFNFMANFGKPRPEPSKKLAVPAVRPRHAGRLRLLPRDGPARERRREVLQGRGRVLERGDEARHLRRVLEGPQPPAAPQEHQAGGADRRRLVRRREPVRGAGDVQAGRGDRRAEGRQPPRHGPVGPRRLGARRRRRSSAT